MDNPLALAALIVAISQAILNLAYAYRLFKGQQVRPGRSPRLPGGAAPLS